MPAPAVYVIAVVGTVGVAIAFKELIYPHIAPRIDRWKAEFQAAKRRRAEAERSAVMAEVALIQRGTRKDGYHNIEHSDSNSDHSDVDLGKGTSTLGASAHPSMKNGLLIRRQSGQSETILTKPGDVELDWITGTSTATETGSEQPDFRLRKNTGSESIQSIHRTPLSPTTTRGIITCSENTESHAFLDESTSPIRTPTPTHVLYNSSSTHSPLDTPFSTRVSSPLREEALLSKTNDTNTATFAHPLLASSPCAADTATASASNPASLPPGLENIAAPEVVPFLPVGVDGTMIPDSSVTPPLVSLSSPPALAIFSPPSQLLSPTSLHPSPYQTPPHVHVIPSLSQSYPLDDLLDYEHGLELLSPPSPLSRADSPFELAGLSPRPGIAERSTLLFADSGEQISAAPVDSITNSTRSTTYLSFSSPALSASSILPSSENGYENDSSSSELSSTFSSPSVASNRLRDIGWESLPPHDDQPHLSCSMSPLPSRSLPSFNVSHPQLQPHHRQQQERNTEWASMRISVPAVSALIKRPQESDARHPMVPNDNEYDDHADTQRLSPRNSTRSPWMLERTATDSATTSTLAEIHPLESATRLSSDFDVDTGSELSDLDFLSMSAEENEASTVRSRSVVYTGANGGNGVRRDGRMGGSGIGDGNESDTSSWSLAGGSE